MNSIAKTVLATVIAAGICANVAVLFQFQSRLASIETILRLMPQPQHTANSNQNQIP